MQFEYPMRLIRQDNGRMLVRFPDVPEALTEGESQAEAKAVAEDCLVAALGGYIELRRDLPHPSRARRGQQTVALPPLVSAKLALYQAMRHAGMSGTALGRRLGVSEAAVRRLLDLDHRSHIGQVQAGLAALGKRLVLEIRDAA